MENLCSLGCYFNTARHKFCKVNAQFYYYQKILSQEAYRWNEVRREQVPPSPFFQFFFLSRLLWFWNNVALLLQLNLFSVSKVPGSSPAVQQSDFTLALQKVIKMGTRILIFIKYEALLIKGPTVEAIFADMSPDVHWISKATPIFNLQSYSIL